MVAQQVDELAHQERRHWAQRARLHQRLHNDATHLGLSARSERPAMTMPFSMPVAAAAQRLTIARRETSYRKGYVVNFVVNKKCLMYRMKRNFFRSRVQSNRSLNECVHALNTTGKLASWIMINELQGL